MKTGRTWVATMNIPMGLKIVPLRTTNTMLPMRVATHDARGEKGMRPASQRAAIKVDQ